MLIETGEYVHVIYRALFESSVRRHFLGEVKATEGAVCRLEGYVFVYDQKTATYVKRPDKRTTIIDLSESGYIVNIVKNDIVLEEIIYEFELGTGLVAKDGKGFALNINEFSAKF